MRKLVEIIEASINNNSTENIYDKIPQPFEGIDVIGFGNFNGKKYPTDAFEAFSRQYDLPDEPILYIHSFFPKEEFKGKGLTKKYLLKTLFDWSNGKLNNKELNSKVGDSAVKDWGGSDLFGTSTFYNEGEQFFDHLVDQGFLEKINIAKKMEGRALNLFRITSKTKNLQLTEQRQLKETILQTKTIVNVDIQPEYEDYMSFDVYDWVEFLNNNSENNDIVFLYNGAETLGMIGEGDYINWLFELGVEEDVINRAYFYDKGYAFFRFCMDSDIDEDNIADLVKYMYRNDINDSRDMDQDMWDDFMEWTGEEQGAIRELLEYDDDMINIPELMEYLIQYSNIVLLGGGMNECLKEVEIALKGLDKTYDMLSQYVY